MADQIEVKRKRQRERRRKRIESRQEKWKHKQEEERAREVARIQEIHGKGRRRAMEKSKWSDEDAVSTEIELESPQMPTFDDEELTSSDEEIPMYFNTPEQLLDIFQSLEDETLFLFQNKQETEQSLEEMTQRFEKSKSDVQTKADASSKTINDINSSIVTKNKFVDSLKKRVECKASDSLIKEAKLFNELENKIKQVYRACGFKFSGTTPRVLHMLAEVETKMEDIIKRIQTIPEAEFQRENKIKKKNRRDAKRIQVQAEQVRLQEERNRKALERSMLPPKKVVGKKVRAKYLWLQ
jgi:hypothetical protein